MNRSNLNRSDIESIAIATSKSLNLDIVVFSTDGQILYSTPSYTKKKGFTVHTTFIKDVLKKGNVLVTSPGNMTSCVGCRFKNNCPSTIEILYSMHDESDVIGIVGFTSFTEEGQNRISNNIEVYTEAIISFSNLLSKTMYKDYHSTAEAMIASSIEISNSAIVLIDPYGIIVQYNSKAKSLLNLNSSKPTNINDFFDNDFSEKILSTNKIYNEKAFLKEFSADITTNPVLINNSISGIYLSFDNIKILKKSNSSFMNNIIGRSVDIDKIKKIIPKIANSPSPLLITGETGTGKEILAKSIHEFSSRQNYPFIAVNCSSIPENLFESELFGYEGGSFTGAKKSGKKGKIEMAQGGTLFLDELGEMPLSVQPKLLRVLQEYELEPIGSNRKIKLDIRIIASTNRNLEDMMENKLFREDLFYRINVLNIEIPPLRERKSDIIPIAENYIKKLQLKLNTNFKKISPDVEKIFLSYSWPGNIRELQNIIEYSANISSNETLDVFDLPKSFLNKYYKLSEMSHRLKTENDTILELLNEYGNSVEGKKKIAEIMGISLRTLYRKINNLQFK